MIDFVQEARESNLILTPGLAYSKVSKLLLTCFEQIVVAKHLQDNAVFLVWELVCLRRVTGRL